MVEFHADFAINHLGNLNLLYRMVEKAKWAGCDYVKIQRKDVGTFYTQDRLAKPVVINSEGQCGMCDIPQLLPYGKTYGEYRSTFEFDMEQLRLFDKHCRVTGIPWYATIQDEIGLHVFGSLDLPMYKVPSCDARNMPFLNLIQRVLPDDKPVVISVAGSTLKEIENTLSLFSGRRIYLLHCVAEYPSDYEALRLGNIPELKKHFASDKVTIGYSGHEEGILPSLAAVDMGAEVVNRHFTIIRHKLLERLECALEPEEYKELIDRVRHGDLEYTLPDKAFESWFGMTDEEGSFLTDQEYKGVK